MARPTCCAFGGPGLDVLYVTTASQNMTEAERQANPLAGALLALDVGFAACRSRASSDPTDLPSRPTGARMNPIKLASIEAFAFRVPIEKPIKVAFGTFGIGPSVRAVDTDGVEGWGEAWCDWPAVGEHRARLVADLGEPAGWPHIFRAGGSIPTVSSELEVLVLQTGEVGPIAQAIAGIDIAVSDLAARKAGQPLYRSIGGALTDSVPVYATGINPDQPEIFAAERQAEGHTAFKLKIGFGTGLDLRNLAALRETLGEAAS